MSVLNEALDADRAASRVQAPAAQTEGGAVVTRDRSIFDATVCEILPTLRLAIPIVIAELGWMAMGVVDLMMVGRLGTTAIAAVGLGNIVFFAITVCGIGLMMGLDTVVSQAFGGGRVRECHQWMIQGCWLAVLCSPVLILLLFGVIPLLPHWGLELPVVAQARSYLQMLALGTLPLYLYFVFRRYLLAMNITRPALWALLAANIMNLLFNWVLIEGNLGAPRLGVTGSALSTVLARVALFGILAWCAFDQSRRHGTGLREVSWRLDPSRLVRLIKIGAPAGVHFTFEVGVFAMAAVLAGRLGQVSLAAHEVVLNVASVTFMVPFGIASAGSARVGQSVGRRDARDAIANGWAALLLGGGFMTCAGLTFVLFPHRILSIFSPEGVVIATALPLLAAAAMFQLFDGLQVVAGGILRGAGHTRAPMYASLVSYWVLGLPLGAMLAFPLHVGVLGLWIGLCAGLITAALYLMAYWVRTLRQWRREGVRPVHEEHEGLEAVSHTC